MMNITDEGIVFSIESTEGANEYYNIKDSFQWLLEEGCDKIPISKLKTCIKFNHAMDPSLEQINMMAKHAAINTAPVNSNISEFPAQEIGETIGNVMTNIYELEHYSSSKEEFNKALDQSDIIKDLHFVRTDIESLASKEDKT